MVNHTHQQTPQSCGLDQPSSRYANLDTQTLTKAQKLKTSFWEGDSFELDQPMEEETSRKLWLGFGV